MAAQNVSMFHSQIEEILTPFSNEELTSLAITITGGLLKCKINSRQDAIKVIILYSEDIPSILRRKLFTREKLLSYLYDKDVVVKLPITKPEIISRILNFWKSGDSNTVVESSATKSIDKSDNLLIIGETNCENPSGSNEISTTSYSFEVSNQDSKNNLLSTVDLLAYQFSEWFYKLLNDNELTSVHFFPDALLNLSLQSAGQIDSNTVSNDATEITSYLLNTKTRHDLVFNPNLLKEGLKSQMDPHGIVMVVVCGTLHSKQVCVGIFQQMFALARDPSSENNWKIKRTDLILKSGNCDKTPILCDFDELGNRMVNLD